MDIPWGSIISGTTNLAGSFLNFGATVYGINHSPDVNYNPTTVIRVPDLSQGQQVSAFSPMTILIGALIAVLLLAMVFLTLKIVS